MVDKQQIKNLISEDYRRLQSLTKLEIETGVSKGYLSQILNGKHDPHEATWNKLANHYRISQKHVWTVVDTENKETCMKLFEVAREFKSLHCIIGHAGSGKSTASEKYARNRRNTFLIKCRDYTQKRFLEELCKSMYVISGGTKTDLIDAIRKKLNETENALLILDEASMLNDSCLLLVKEIYGDRSNSLSGIVMLSVPYLKLNLTAKARKGKRGFSELVDRIYFPFVRLKEASETDIARICYANGIDDESLIDKAVEKCRETGSYRGVETAVMISQL